jgi:hypothetical protein
MTAVFPLVDFMPNPDPGSWKVAGQPVIGIISLQETMQAMPKKDVDAIHLMMAKMAPTLPPDAHVYLWPDDIVPPWRR